MIESEYLPENAVLLCEVSIDYSTITKVLNDLKSVADSAGFFVLRLDHEMTIFTEDLTSMLSFQIENCKIRKITEGQCCFKIKSQVFAPLIKKLNAKAELILEVFDTHILIKQNNSSFSVYTNAYEHNRVSDINDSDFFEFDPKIFNKGIKAVGFAAAKENLEHFNGVFISIQHEKIKFFAADKSRFSLFEEQLENISSTETEIFIKKKGITAIEKILSTKMHNCLIQVDEKTSSIIIKDHNMLYVSSLGQKKEMFNYESIIVERSVFAKFNVDKTDFTKILDRMNILSSVLAYYVTLTVDENELEVSAYDPNGGCFVEKMSIENMTKNSGHNSVKLNIKYVIDALSSINTNDVTVTLQKHGACFLRTETFLHCIMPIKGL